MFPLVLRRPNCFPFKSTSRSGAMKCRALAYIAAAAFALAGSGCMKGPNYQRPVAAVPEHYKEAPPDGWKTAQPGDGVIRGKWWEIFGDPALNTLEEQINISNQNVLQAEAQFREAVAAVKIARTALFPTVTTTPSIAGEQTSSRVTGSRGVTAPFFELPVNASYTADVWGAIRRSVRASANTAQSLDAALENVRLLYQSELASDYFTLHGLDGDFALLQETAKSYDEYLHLTRVRFAGGVATDADVSEAETQLYTTQAELVDIGVQRTQAEHAIAVLIGKPPRELELPRYAIQTNPPVIPVGMPSTLLERRPDIADAERQAAAANEQIGIAQSAFYPTITLAAQAGVESTSILNWITWPARFWTIGPQLAQILFDAGKRTAQVQQAQAAYDATAAAYRQSVLTAFQQVEDNLSALRVLEQEAGVTDDAVRSAKRSVDVTTAQYKGGTVNYLSVIQVQTIALSDERAAIDLKTRRMVASVGLVQALGGGWDNAKLPTRQEVGDTPVPFQPKR
ncbi:MAG TPA: efflux transporter outer membrane subunit [Bryobacteraceae bacterium]|nr:efflux transporter outer membrane subunit [Bryobacteraceae bacterium]